LDPGGGRALRVPTVLKALEPFREDLLVVTGPAIAGNGRPALLGPAPLPDGLARSGPPAPMSVGCRPGRRRSGENRCRPRVGCGVSRSVGTATPGIAAPTSQPVLERALTPIPGDKPASGFRRLFGSLAGNPDPRCAHALTKTAGASWTRLTTGRGSSRRELGPRQAQSRRYLSSIREIEAVRIPPVLTAQLRYREAQRRPAGIREHATVTISC
jgi:hypothetical protein